MIHKNREILIALYILTCLILSGSLSFGQMPGQDGQPVYGNEWISYDKTYLRIPVGDDGWFALEYNQIKAAGWDEELIRGSSLVLFHNGKQVPLEPTTDGIFTEVDQIIFYGRKNRSELEHFMFYHPDRQLLNPEYSLFTDTSVYFLTIDPAIPKMRYQNRDLSSQDKPVERVWTMSESVFSGHFYTQAGQGIIDPDFNDLEGFATAFGNRVSREIDLNDVKPLGDSIYLDVGVGADLNTRSFSLFINDQLYKEFTNELAQSARQIKLAWPVEDIGNTITIALQGKEDRDRVCLTFVRIKHMISPHRLDTVRYSSFQIDGSASVHNLQLSESVTVDRVCNLTQGTFYNPRTNGDILNFTLEGNPDDEFVLLGSTRRPVGTKPVNFKNYLDQDFDYLIISSDSLMQGAEQSAPVSDYAGYRRSEKGGGYRVGVVSIEQLRDQYIYGIQGHPYAIRNFISQLIDVDHGLRYVNIIGKGIGYGYLRSEADYRKYQYNSHFVPTLGHYGSDNLLMAAKGHSIPRVPVGRIPVTNTGEISQYLEKVKTYEAMLHNPGQLEDRRWMKRVMHFNGGDRNIFSIIANFMDGLGNDIQRDSFAAELVSYYKSSFGSTDIPDRDEIFSFINDGAALISFFGHSASSSLDFNIDIIGEYANQGRLPVFLALGCSSGNIFLPQKNLAERFVLTPDIGSILFLSTATSEYLSNLQNLARTFYKEIGGDQYGQPLGDIVRQSLADLGRFQKHLQSVFVFTGDPAIAAYHFDGPDFTFDPSSVRLTPARPSLVDDAFTMEVNIQNLGLRIRDTFAVVVRQKTPGGEIRTLDTAWTNIDGFDHSLSLSLPVSDDMEGKNTYFLTIDPDNNIDEYPSGAAETNNVLTQDEREGFDVFIQNTTLQLVYPYDMAIVPDARPHLELFNGNVEGNPKNYVIELDTTPHFSSPEYRSYSRASTMARVIFSLDIPLEEKVVYYWRARWAQDSVFTPYHSFIWLPGRTGWNQSHYGQFYRDSLENLAVEERKLEFARLQNVYKLDHGNKKAAIIFNEIHRPRFIRTAYPALNVSIFKPRKNTWVRNPKPGLYNSIWPVSKDEYLFTFVFRPYSENQRTSIIELIEQEADPGDYVIFWNTTRGGRSPEGDTWAQDSTDHQGVNLFNFFEKQGASQIRALAQEDRRAYSLIYQKGNAVVTEILGDSAGVNIEYVNLYSFVSDGRLHTGDVDLLQSLDGWESGVNTSGTDSVDMTLQAGMDTEEIHFDASATDMKSGSLSMGETTSFSWRASISDVEDRTLPSFFWRVYGLFRPDWRISNITDKPLVDTAALSANMLSIQFKIDARGDPPADSVLVSVELFNGSRTVEHRLYISAPQLGNDLHFEWPLGPQYNGPTVLKVTVDPDHEWKEANENNNSVFRNFDIRGDRIAPTIEVLFDHLSILNGEIIAPDALISIHLADYPNNNLATEPDFDFEIKKPSGEILKIDAGDPNLTVESTKEGTELRYQSDFKENGIYELHINVRDVVGNIQKSDYYIEFEVVLDNSVSTILPYPNPFVDAVRFAYTLTGTEEPEVFRIMIYTVSGRLVKEITKAEFGPMRIGRHLSEYVWEGRDNWNQELAPGVYLYKVISRDAAGDDYEKYRIGELDDRNYFKNGIGKMVKLR